MMNVDWFCNVLSFCSLGYAFWGMVEKSIFNNSKGLNKIKVAFISFIAIYIISKVF